MREAFKRRAVVSGSFKPLLTKSQDVAVAPTSRVNINDKVALNKGVSVRIISSQPIVAERPMYFFYGGVWSGGHDVVGYAP